LRPGKERGGARKMSMTRCIRYPAMKSASCMLALIVGVLILCAVLPARAQYACTTN
jgi:hypothetical protein